MDIVDRIKNKEFPYISNVKIYFLKYKNIASKAN